MPYTYNSIIQSHVIKYVVTLQVKIDGFSH